MAVASLSFTGAEAQEERLRGSRYSHFTLPRVQLFADIIVGQPQSPRLTLGRFCYLLIPLLRDRGTTYRLR